MVHVDLKNKKLSERGIGILERATGTDRETAKRALQQSGNSVSVALVMLETSLGRASASKALRDAAGKCSPSHSEIPQSIFVNCVSVSECIFDKALQP